VPNFCGHGGRKPNYCLGIGNYLVDPEKLNSPDRVHQKSGIYNLMPIGLK
jgi:hypothetical protein